MGLLKKMSTAFRGMAYEAGEEFVDSNAVRIFEQEIRDAREELNKAKTALSELMGKRKVQENEVKRLEEAKQKYLAAAEQALAQTNETLALECAERVAELDEELEGPKTLVADFTTQEKQLHNWVKQSENNLKRIERQLDSVKATEQVQKARAAVAAKYSGTSSGLTNAADSLERIKKKQAERTAQFDAAQELADTGTSDLDAKLNKAGIGSTKKSAQEILAGLKKTS